MMPWVPGTLGLGSRAGGDDTLIMGRNSVGGWLGDDVKEELKATALARKSGEVSEEDFQKCLWRL